MAYTFVFVVEPPLDDQKQFWDWHESLPESEQLMADITEDGRLRFDGSYTGTGRNIGTYFPRLIRHLGTIGRRAVYKHGDYCPHGFENRSDG